MEYTIRIKSSDTIVDGKPFAPTSLENGELALNYSKNKETLFFKNTDGEIFNFDFNAVNKLKEELISDEMVVAESIKEISESSGIISQDGSIGYDTTGTNYLSASKSIVNSLKILDKKIKEIEDKLA